MTQLGGVSVSYSVPHKSDEERTLISANRKLIKALGISHGTTHAEFIKSDLDGELYFLEAGARVDGAHTAEALEAARGINLWREWAKIEMAQIAGTYKLGPIRQDYSGIALSLARQEHPETSRYDDPEIVFRVTRPYHVGLIIRSPDLDRVRTLLDGYTHRFMHDFTAVVPQQERIE